MGDLNSLINEDAAPVPSVYKLQADPISVVSLGIIHASLVLPRDNYVYLINCSQPDTLLETAYSSAQNLMLQHFHIAQ